MKKTTIYLPLFVIAICVIGLTFDVIIPSSYALSSSPHIRVDYNEQVLWQQDLLWNLGKNLSVGDSYTYKICDPEAVQTSAANYHYFVQGKENHNSSVCYMIKLDFVNLLNSDENHINSDVWVVQAAISDVITKRDVRYSVFHVDTQTFEVRSADTIHPDTIKYAESLQKTLFSLFKYTAPEPQLLQIGTEWGEVTEALHERGENPNMAVLENSQEYSVTQNNIRMIDNHNIPVTRNIADAFKVGYEIDIFDPFIISDDTKKKKIVEEEDNNNVTNYFLIYSELPFPLLAVSYNPVYIMHPQKQYEFELVAFLTNNKNVDLGTNHVLEESDVDNVISELPPETGTIALTFPDEVVPAEEEEDDTAYYESIIPDIDVIDEDLIQAEEEDVVVPDEYDIDNISANDTTQSDNIDYVKITGLAVLLIVMIAGFVVLKKFKESGFKTGIKKTLKKKQQHTVKETIQFDDKLHIDIKAMTDDT